MNQLVDNPFFVLGLLPDASRIEIELEHAEELLGLALDLDPAREDLLDPVGAASAHE